MAAIPGVDSPLACIKERRVFHFLNHVDHNVQSRVSGRQLPVPIGNGGLKKNTIGGLKFSTHLAPLYSAGTPVQRNRNR